jgi:hypothetical protein
MFQQEHGMRATIELSLRGRIADIAFGSAPKNSMSALQRRAWLPIRYRMAPFQHVAVSQFVRILA